MNNTIRTVEEANVKLKDSLDKCRNDTISITQNYEKFREQNTLCFDNASRMNYTMG